MPIVVTPTYRVGPRTDQGVPLAFAQLVVTGLTAGAANDIAHGLPRTPIAVTYRPNGAGDWHEDAAPTATVLNVTVAAGGPTAFTIDCWY